MSDNRVKRSRRTLRNIRANPFRALPHDAALIRAAAVGLLNPLLTGATMALSSVFVGFDSLRLRSFALSRRGASGA